jgi:ATP synthase protein I
MPPESERKGPTKFVQQFALAMELPFVFAGAVIVGGLLGYFLDQWLNTRPAFLLVLGFLGFFAGLREILRRVKMSGARKDDGDGGTGGGTA